MKLDTTRDTITDTTRDTTNGALPNLQELINHPAESRAKIMAYNRKNRKKPSERRTNTEIQKAILKTLIGFPKSTHAIARDIGASKITVSENCKFLEQNNKITMKKIEQIKVFRKTNTPYIQINTYWKLNEVALKGLEVEHGIK